MGLNELLAGLAVRAAHVLVIEPPGQWSTRVELDHQMLRRGWRRAWTPADADVLAVCGVPGPELAELVDLIWEQMPGPRVRTSISSPDAVALALRTAADLLLDTPGHRADAQGRLQEPQLSDDSNDMDDGDLDHGEHDGTSPEEHPGMRNPGHDKMEHDQTDHENHDGHGGHGGMDMAPAGIPLAQAGEDRDGLEMDVLQLPLGPVLPFWPAGLVLRCSLQGDVVVDAEAAVIDNGGYGTPEQAKRPGPMPVSAAVRCDNALALLALAGADDAAARARHARDTLLQGEQDAAQDAVERLYRTVRKSRLLRWSLRSVLPLTSADLERHGLPSRCLGDAHDRLLWSLDVIRAETRNEEPVEPIDGGVVPWAIVPHLVTGLEVASVRLAVASLDLVPFPAVQETRHV